MYVHCIARAFEIKFNVDDMKSTQQTMVKSHACFLCDAFHKAQRAAKKTAMLKPLIGQ
jgi:hypothetical protein